MMSPGGRVSTVLGVERQQRLRNPRLDLGLMVKGADDASDNTAQIDLHIGLDGDVDVLIVMAGEPRQAIKRLPDRVQSGERNFQRALLLGLAGDLIDPVAQLQIGAAERFLRGQQRQRRRAARRLLSDGIRRRQFQAIRAVTLDVVNP
jgi:hypothetical protein